ncbi:MAG: Asp-tRNA(Asn)/Glu-tRNA(Gln) amidotransferase subunit GatC [Pseudomonadota bacterium]
MSVTDQDIAHVAKLARLEVADPQRHKLREELSSILNFVAQIEAANTDDISPLANPIELDAWLRSDTVLETDQREKFQTNAPATADGLYLVPKVID